MFNVCVVQAFLASTRLGCIIESLIAHTHTYRDRRVWAYSLDKRALTDNILSVMCKLILSLLGLIEKNI